MSDTPTVVVPRKHGHYEEREWHRHHSYHSCLNLLLRLLTAGATLSAVIVMALSNETRYTPYGYFRGRWVDYPAYKWFIIANSVVFVYAILGAVVAFFSLILRRGPLSYAGSAWLTFLFDFIAASALISAASTALVVELIARNGQDSAGWSTYCNWVSRFCDHIQGAIIASFIGFGFMALSTMLAASALRHLAWERLH